MNEKTLDKIKELRADGHTVWSISRINSIHNCEFEYYNTYVLRKRGKQNCYSVTGSFIHDKIEQFYKGDDSVKFSLTDDFEVHMEESEILGLDFPSEDIRKNFTEDIKHFTEHFKKLDGKFLLEKLMLFELDGHYIQGYIDAIQVIENEEGSKDVNLYDWKTSSKFAGKAKLESAGRQLLLYKLGLEATSKANINTLSWCMIKYLYVCHVQKNGKIKKKMCSRRKLIKDMKPAFEKEMLASGMDDLEVDIVLEEALKTNSMDNLPQFIKDKYWIEDCYVEYEATEERIQELKDYVNNTIALIESKNPNDASDWKPVDFEKDSFYCNHLCNHREICPFLKEYKKGLNLDKKNVTLDDLF